MFPKYDELSKDIFLDEKANTDLSFTPDFNFVENKIVLANGTPKLVTDIDAVKNWILLFIKTPKDVYPIYKGTVFGTSVRKLFGSKIIGNGYEEAEIQRELEEGLILCPAIRGVSSFKMYKMNKILYIDLVVELFNGSLISLEDIDVYTVK